MKYFVQIHCKLSIKINSKLTNKDDAITSDKMLVELSNEKKRLELLL